MAFLRIEAKILHQTNEWGSEADAASLLKGEALLIVVSNGDVKTYTLAASDPKIAELTKTLKKTVAI